MAITLIHGPKKCGKTRNAEFLRKRFKAEFVVDGFYPRNNRFNGFFTDSGPAPDRLENSVILTNADPVTATLIAKKIGAKCISYAAALQPAGL